MMNTNNFSKLATTISSLVGISIQPIIWKSNGYSIDAKHNFYSQGITFTKKLTSRMLRINR